ncbi:hypothetical protein E2C01_092692 [Portunus trituberculatus]|uniref:Uncharacterized protein n=1 Tax=Portunus trituberculatus TaxID=210409 RepID=A0A5B7JR81_PORTR|nr:hypothetical protein [Portunus trituberculatus]
MLERDAPASLNHTLIFIESTTSDGTEIDKGKAVLPSPFTLAHPSHPTRLTPGKSPHLTFLFCFSSSEVMSLQCGDA